MLGRSRDCIRSAEELAKAKESCQALDLDGLVVSCHTCCTCKSVHVVELESS